MAEAALASRSIRASAGAALAVAVGLLGAYLPPTGVALLCAGLIAGAAIALGRRDVVAVVALLLVLLFVFPSRYVVVGPLRSVGTPATLVALGAGGLWLVARLALLPGLDRGRQPVRLALAYFALTLVAAYAVAAAQPLSAFASAGSDRSLLTFAAVIGLSLYVLDTVQRRQDLDTLLRLAVVGAALSGLVGFAQSIFRLDYLALVRFPGLRLNGEVPVEFRGFLRVTGSSIHPIEFSVVLAALLPVAVHYAMHTPPGRYRTALRVAVGVLATAVPLSVSRTGVLGLLIAVVGIALGLTWRHRLNFVLVLVPLIGVLSFVRPGLLGTLRSLFANAERDPSITGRTVDYAVVGQIFAENRFLGIGLGVFSPADFFFLDNQYLGTIIGGGLLGLSGLVCLFLTPMWLCWRVVRHSRSQPADRGLARALLTALVVLAACGLTFDEFAFRQVLTLLFFIIGAAGALWRVSVRSVRRRGLAGTTSAGTASA